MPVSSSPTANCGALMCCATIVTLALSLVLLGESVSADQIDSDRREEFFQRAGVKQLTSPQKAVAALCKQTQSQRANGTRRDAYLARCFSASAAVSAPST